ncbi:ABC transporter permease [Planctomycetota bacterium]
MLKSNLRRILTIWHGTYLRAFRDRSLIVVSCFCAFLVLALLLMNTASPDALESAVAFGVFAAIAPGIIISIFIGNFTVSSEIEDHTLAILFSKPVSRGQFLMGKYAGILSMGLLYYGILATIFAAVMLIKGQLGTVWLPFVCGLMIWGIFLAMLTSLSIMFSVLLPGIGGIIITFVLVSFTFIGMIHMRLLTVLVRGTPAQYLLLAAYYVIPNGLFFDFQFHNASLTIAAMTVFYGFWYTAFFLVLAHFFFNRKELG